MKKLLFVILFLSPVLGTSGAFAQNSENGTTFVNTGSNGLLGFNGDPMYRLLATRFENWDSLQKTWIRTDSMRYFYSQDNLVDRVEGYKFSAGKWLNDMKETHSYDSNKNRLFLLRQTWKGNIWADDSRVIYAYDNNNNRLVAQNQSWLNNAWKDVNRSLFEYDSHNNRTKWTRQRPQNNAWVNQLRYIYQYDAGQRQTAQITQTWDINSGAWANIQHSTYTYNAAGLQQEELVKTWKDSVWVNNLRATHQYAANGHLENTLRELWVNNAWTVYSQNQLEYNKDNLVKLAEYVWGDNQWQHNTLYENAYDGHNNHTFQRYSTGKGPLWVNVQQLFSYYEQSTGIPAGAENSLSFSAGPSPGNGIFTIRYSDLIDRLKYARIIDMSGKLVSEMPLSGTNTETLDLSRLPDGTYQMWVSTRQGKQGMKKVVIVK